MKKLILLVMCVFLPSAMFAQQQSSLSAPPTTGSHHVGILVGPHLGNHAMWADHDSKEGPLRDNTLEPATNIGEFPGYTIRYGETSHTVISLSDKFYRFHSADINHGETDVNVSGYKTTSFLLATLQQNASINKTCFNKTTEEYTISQKFDANKIEREWKPLYSHLEFEWVPASGTHKDITIETLCTKCN